MNPDPAARTRIAILAKAPVPGQAKTRLIPALGAEGAAALQHWLLQRTVATALAANIGPVTLWYAGDHDHPALTVLQRDSAITLQPQPAGDLGARMLCALSDSSSSGGTLVIGTDCPALTAEHLRQAAQSLREHEAVIYPAEDGGYVLIGMKQPMPTVFEHIDWGTAVVMEQTRARLAVSACRWYEGLTLWDVDRPDDLARLFELYPDSLNTFRHLQ